MRVNTAFKFVHICSVWHGDCDVAALLINHAGCIDILKGKGCKANEFILVCVLKWANRHRI